MNINRQKAINNGNATRYARHTAGSVTPTWRQPVYAAKTRIIVAISGVTSDGKLDSKGMNCASSRSSLDKRPARRNDDLRFNPRYGARSGSFSGSCKTCSRLPDGP
jgi:hypothetical protein